MSFSWEHGEATIPLGQICMSACIQLGWGGCSSEQCHRVIDRNFKENDHENNLIK